MQSPLISTNCAHVRGLPPVNKNESLALALCEEFNELTIADYVAKTGVDYVTGRGLLRRLYEKKMVTKIYRQKDGNGHPLAWYRLTNDGRRALAACRVWSVSEV